MNRSISILFLLLHVIFHASSLNQLPVTIRKESEILPDNEDRSDNPLYRTRRKASNANVDISSPAVEYMIGLRESLTDENGIPRIATDDPTNIWCLLDKGMNAMRRCIRLHSALMKITSVSFYTAFLVNQSLIHACIRLGYTRLNA